MDLLASIRKSGSRGGVNFSWDEVASSAHRENYLGHSLKAPVGRWQKGKDLNWYAKADSVDADVASVAGSVETPEERRERERREELRKVKLAEEDAMARALGLPPPQRNATGANSVQTGPRRDVEATGNSPAARPELRRDGSRHDDNAHKKDWRQRLRSRSRDHRRHREHRRRSRDAIGMVDGSRHVDRPRDYSPDGRGRTRGEHRHEQGGNRSRSRSRSAGRRERRHRQRSRDRNKSWRKRSRSQSREHGIRRRPSPSSWHRDRRT